jgi:hypothetical protein
MSVSASHGSSGSISSSVAQVATTMAPLVNVSNVTDPSTEDDSLSSGVPFYIIFVIIVGLIGVFMAGFYFLFFWQKNRIDAYLGKYREQVKKDREMDQAKEGAKVAPEKLYSGVPKDFHLQAEESSAVFGDSSPPPQNNRAGPRSKIPTFRDLESQRTANQALSQRFLEDGSL